MNYKIVPYLPHVIWGGFLVYFLAHMVSGNRGLISYMRFKKEYTSIDIELSDLKRKNAILENKLALLMDNHINYDLLEEEAIKTLGIVKQGDVVINVR